MRRLLVPTGALVAMAAVLSVMPGMLPTFETGLLTEGLIWAIFAMSLGILLTYGGMASLGHAAFFGTGAYVAALATTRYDVHNFFLVLAITVAASALLGLAVALIAVRTRGIYLLLVTLAFAEMLHSVAFKWRDITGGDDGVVGVLRPDLAPLPWSIVFVDAYYQFVVVAFLACAALMYLFISSPFGGALTGVRESERRMLALGYNTTVYRVGAFVAAAAFAGVAGALYAYYNRFVNPADVSPLVSARALLLVILGAKTFLGPAIAAVGITALEEAVSSRTEHWLLVLGALYVAVSFVGMRRILGPVGRAYRRAAALARIATRSRDGAGRVPGRIP